MKNKYKQNQEITAKSCVEELSTTQLLFEFIFQSLRAAWKDDTQFLGTWWLPSIPSF